MQDRDTITAPLIRNYITLWPIGLMQNTISSYRTYFVYVGGYALAQLECGPMPNVMAALPNIGGALCSTPQFG